IIPVSCAGFPQISGECTIGDERLRLFIVEGSRSPGSRIHLDNAICLMTSLIVFKREGSAIFPPCWIRQAVRIGEQRVIYNGLFPGLYDEDYQVARRREHHAVLRNRALNAWVEADPPARILRN